MFTSGASLNVCFVHSCKQLKTLQYTSKGKSQKQHLTYGSRPVVICRIGSISESCDSPDVYFRDDTTPGWLDDEGSKKAMERSDPWKEGRLF